MARIASLHAREILDSRGNPTVEVDLVLEGGVSAVAMVPSGASTGIHEAVELRDGDKSRYGGKGVLTAVNNVNGEISTAVLGKEWTSQEEIDKALITLDGTPNKGRLGANAILGVSMAFARAVAKSEGLEMYEYFGKVAGNTVFGLPTPIMNVVNGGKHADSGLDVQEFMVMPIGIDTFKEKLRAGAEIFHALKKILAGRGMVTSVGDEGGFAPHLAKNEDAIEVLIEAITAAGYSTDKVKIAMDVAASSFYEDGGYACKIGSGLTGGKATSDELIEWYSGLIQKYPVVSIEDPLFEDDWDAFGKMTAQLGDKIIIVGDDLFVTNVDRIKTGIEKKSANSVLIKMNQIGTIWESIEAIKLTQSVGWKPIVSHRSGETEDTTLADLCVGLNCPIIKTGSLCRSERVAKYNRLLAIEERLNSK